MKQPVVWSYWNHEPIYHLKRMGNDGGTVFSLGEWTDEWYDRIHGEELLKKAADIGINTVYTHYYKGSGLEFEHAEMERTREFTELAHKYGIKVLGYVSLGSFYTENICSEIPDVYEMLAVDNKGEYLPTLEHQYYRLSPCFNSDRYRAYIKKVLKYGVEHVGLDGFHFDQSTRHFCYCETCKKKFREYLKQNIADPYHLMGIKDFEHVEIPSYKVEYSMKGMDLATGKAFIPKGNVHDTLLMWYLRFVRETVKSMHQETFDYVKEVSGGKALVLHNPGFPKFTNDFRVKGFDPRYSPASSDFAFVENFRGYFAKEGGRTHGQIEAFKFAERYGYKVFDTSWLCTETTLYRYPRSKEEVEKFSYQSAVFGAIAGSPWTVRSMKNRADVAIDIDYLYDGLKESFGYFKDNYAIFEAKAYNHVKLLYICDNFYASETGKEDFTGVLEILAKNQIPFSIIDESDIAALKEDDVIILPNIQYAAKSVYRDLKKAAERGTKIVRVGSYGIYNEETKGISESDECFQLNGIKSKVVISQNAPKEELIDAVGNRIAINLEDVVVETKIMDDGRLVLHLLNADNTNGVKQLEVAFADQMLTQFNHASVLAPNEIRSEVKLEGNVAKICVDDYKTLVSVVFE